MIAARVAARSRWKGACLQGRVAFGTRVPQPTSDDYFVCLYLYRNISVVFVSSIDISVHGPRPRRAPDGGWRHLETGRATRLERRLPAVASIDEPARLKFKHYCFINHHSTHYCSLVTPLHDRDPGDFVRFFTPHQRRVLALLLLSDGRRCSARLRQAG